MKDVIASRQDLEEKYVADRLKLLLTGKVLDNEKPISSYSIPSDEYLVLVKQRPDKIQPVNGSKSIMLHRSNVSFLAKSRFDIH